MNKNDFKKRIDKELAEVTFSEHNRRMVLEGIRKPENRIRAFLGREITIPVKPLAAALLIAVTIAVYGFAGAIKVSAEDVRKSSIVVIQNDRSQSNEIYKN